MQIFAFHETVVMLLEFSPFLLKSWHCINPLLWYCPNALGPIPYHDVVKAGFIQIIQTYYEIIGVLEFEFPILLRRLTWRRRKWKKKKTWRVVPNPSNVPETPLTVTKTYSSKCLASNTVKLPRLLNSIHLIYDPDCSRM